MTMTMIMTSTSSSYECSLTTPERHALQEDMPEEPDEGEGSTNHDGNRLDDASFEDLLTSAVDGGGTDAWREKLIKFRTITWSANGAVFI